MENTIKKSWRDVTIDEYFDLKDRLDDVQEETDKVVVKISFANNISEEEVWDKTINEFRKLQVEALWMDEFNISEDIKFKNIEINGERYTVDVNLQNFTVAQYIDFQTFFPKRKTNERILGNILACFIIPREKKYASGYDIKKLVDDINSNLDILTANEILLFFLKQYLISIRATANYFNWIMKRMKRKSKNKMEIIKMEMEWNQIKETILDGLRSLTV